MQIERWQSYQKLKAENDYIEDKESYMIEKGIFLVQKNFMNVDEVALVGILRYAEVIHSCIEFIKKFKKVVVYFLLFSYYINTNFKFYSLYC